jgi:hypothetical protein
MFSAGGVHVLKRGGLQMDAAEQLLVHELLALYTAEALESQDLGDAGGNAADVLLDALTVTGSAGIAAGIRLAALGQVSSEVYAALSSSQQEALLQVNPCTICVQLLPHPGCLNEHL